MKNPVGWVAGSAVESSVDFSGKEEVSPFTGWM
jgi:hypothetical protein